jgi:hypothetical protein
LADYATHPRAAVFLPPGGANAAYRTGIQKLECFLDLRHIFGYLMSAGNDIGCIPLAERVTGCRYNEGRKRSFFRQARMEASTAEANFHQGGHARPDDDEQ